MVPEPRVYCQDSITLYIALVLVSVGRWVDKGGLALSRPERIDPQSLHSLDGDENALRAGMLGSGFTFSYGGLCGELGPTCQVMRIVIQELQHGTSLGMHFEETSAVVAAMVLQVREIQCGCG